MVGKSTSTVLLALLGNAFLTIIKFVAFVLSGSGAMLSEAIHSFADSGNQGLLWLGVRRSERPADAMFHYGYGAERFFFALLSAMGIFVLGCGVTVYHGVRHLLHPAKLQVDWITLAVLGISFAVEGWVLLKALQNVSVEKGEQPLLRFIRTSSDPTLLAVLFEDFVACLGVLVAALGILLSVLTGNAIFDALSSIAIGLMLGAVAVWLGYRNRQLILGPAIPQDVERAVIDFLRSQPSVSSVHDIKSRVLAAGHFRLKAELDYDGRSLARQHAAWAKERIPQLAGSGAVDTFVADFGERMLDSLAKEVDRIESELAKRFPRLHYLDLESHAGD